MDKDTDSGLWIHQLSGADLQICLVHPVFGVTRKSRSLLHLRKLLHDQFAYPGLIVCKTTPTQAVGTTTAQPPMF